MGKKRRWTTSEVAYLIDYVEKSANSNYDEAAKHLNREREHVKQKVYELKKKGVIKKGRMVAQVTDKHRVFLNKHFYDYTLDQLSFHMDIPKWLVAKTANEMCLYKYETEKTKRQKIKPKRMKDAENKPKFGLKLGETYTIETKPERKIIGKSYVYTGKLVKICPYVAVFDKGTYRVCEVISNYGVDWKLKEKK